MRGQGMRRRAAEEVTVMAVLLIGDLAYWALGDLFGPLGGCSGPRARDVLSGPPSLPSRGAAL